MGISAKEAAERTGMSKAGIVKALRTGKLSGTKNLNGEWEIEPVELFRVYTPLPTGDDPEAKVSSESVVTTEEHLRTQLALTREIVDRLEKENEFLKEQLRGRLLEDKQRPKPWWQRWFG